MELPAEDHDPLSVDEQRALIPGYNILEWRALAGISSDEGPRTAADGKRIARMSSG